MTFYINIRGRLGNNLFGIALALILKKQYPSHDIKINIGWMMKYYPNDYDNILNLFPNINQYVSNFNIHSIRNKCNRIYTGQILDYENIKDNDNVLFDGFFQRTEYYEKYRDFIKSIFFMNNEKKEINEFVVHIRGGDCWGNNGYGGGTCFPWQPILPISFYKNILKNENNILFVVEKKDDPIVLKLLEYYKNTDKNINVQSEDFLTDFKTLISAKKLSLSVSTFSWWGAFLSDAEVIHVPIGGFFNNDAIQTVHNKDVDWTLNWSNVKKYYFTHKIYFNEWKGDKADVEYVLNN